ncbi:hypothetical protein [Actinomarinicola tropica]|uniref:Uncharacterized protein n=1 Tax=Actinomarinicola tropica TaxID=2789776 RepID=A0A5Q2RDY7_9ACTN|nr:hypothetical protein [Actinomarinicola tropica]QGG95108.1 hypothetical protein GH723_08345 [Actinomarinicola tropica]
MSDDDPRLYVTRDGQYEFHRVVEPALVIRFHAPLDVILHTLDADYVASAWRSARTVLEHHGVDPDRFAWGCGQHSELRAADHHHATRPFLDTLGWVTTSQTDDDLFGILPRGSGWPAPWDAVAAELETSAPPLCLNYDHYEAMVITRRGGKVIAKDDGPTALDIMRVDGADSPVEWALFDPSRQQLSCDAPPDPVDAPWMRLGQAMFEHDEVAVVDAMDAVRTEYSEHGARICLESALRYLMMRPNGRS